MRIVTLISSSCILPHARHLLIVASGEVLESHLSYDDLENDTDMDFSLESSIYGNHHVLGIIEFMLGSTLGFQAACACKAWSKSVVMRRVAIPIADSPLVPLVLPDTTPSESGLFYCYMAHQMLARLRSIRTTLAKAASASNTKRDIKTGLNVLNENKILARINKRFGFPMSEQLMFTGYATLGSQDLNVDLTSLMHAQGRFCLFSTWLVFLSKRGWKRHLAHLVSPSLSLSLLAHLVVASQTTHIDASIYTHIPRHTHI